MDKDSGIFSNKLCSEISEIKMTCIDCVDNYFVAGDEKGYAYSYEINQNNMIILTHCQFISKGKIEQIKCLPHLNDAFILVNGVLYVYSIPRLDLKYKFDNKEMVNIHKIVLNESPNALNQFLIVNKKRKVKFFEYNPEIARLIEMKIEELLVFELPDILEWYGNWFCYANKKKFFVVNIIDGQTHPLEFEVLHVKNIAGYWLINANGLGIFMDINIPKPQNSISFSPKPLISLGLIKSYIIALHDSNIGVYDCHDSSQVQEILLDHGNIGKFLVIGRKRIFYIVSHFTDKKESYQVYELKEMAFEKQIYKLLGELKIDDAMNILNTNVSSSNEEKPKIIEKFFLDCAWSCLKKCDFEKAVKYAKLTNFNPFEFIYLFKNILDVKIPGNPDTLLESQTGAKLEFIEKIAGTNQDYYEKAFNLISQLFEEKRNFLINNFDLNKDQIKKINFLSSDIAIINFSRLEFSIGDTYKMINTNLIKIYVKKNEITKRIWEIINSDIFSCDWDDIENFLYKENSDISKVTLAYLYEKRNKFEEALKIWQDYGNKSDSKIPYSKEACERTQIILKNTQDKKLFHEYIQWVLVKYEKVGFNLFMTTDIVQIEYFFTTIINIVEKNNPNSNLKEKFLEYYIENGATNERYHTILVENYIEKLFKYKKADSPFDLNCVEGKIKIYYDKMEKILHISEFYNKNHILEKIKQSWLIEFEIYLYKRLGMHEEALEKLVKIGVEQMDFDKVENYCSEMKNEKPDLFADLFKILANNYKNWSKALKNAKNDIEKKTFEDYSNIYQKEILCILKKYGDNPSLDPFIVLNELPSEWCINDQSFFEYLTKLIKNYTHSSNKYKVARNLCDMALLYKEKDILEAKDKSITIGSDATICELCKKRIGSTIFCVYPNMKIYHQRCAQNPSYCPVTRTDFSKKQF